MNANETSTVSQHSEAHTNLTLQLIIKTSKEKKNISIDALSTVKQVSFD